jgi:hypothetical protein
MTHLVVDALVGAERLDPVTLLLASGNTNDLFATDNLLGDLHENGSNGTALSALDLVPI